MKFQWNRYLEAWKYGAGLDYTLWKKNIGQRDKYETKEMNMKFYRIHILIVTSLREEFIK